MRSRHERSSITLSGFALTAAMIAYACLCSVAQADRVAFIDVNVLPMDSQRVLRSQTVLIENDTITGIGPSRDLRAPADFMQVRGNPDTYLLPGLADMHTHVEEPNDLVLYTANGVTTILQMGSPKYLDMARIRQILKDKKIVGPHLFASFLIDGPGTGGPFAATAQDAREMVRMAKRHSYEFIKIYNSLTREQFLALTDEAKKQQLGVVGHGVRAFGLPEALFQGQAMVAHAEEFYYTAFHGRTDAELIAPVVRETRNSGAYVTPNLATFEIMIDQWGKPAQVQRYLADPRAAVTSPSVRMIWQRDERQHRSGDFSHVLPFLRAVTKAMHDAGVPLLVGTDSPPIPGVYPGYSVHDDLRSLRQVGLTNYEALVAATRTAGEFIAKHVPNAKRFGLLREGMKADAVLVTGNPLESLEVLKRPIGVLSAGRWMSIDELDDLVEARRQEYELLLRAP